MMQQGRCLLIETNILYTWVLKTLQVDQGPITVLVPEILCICVPLLYSKIFFKLHQSESESFWIIFLSSIDFSGLSPAVVSVEYLGMCSFEQKVSIFLTTSQFIQTSCVLLFYSLIHYHLLTNLQSKSKSGSVFSLETHFSTTPTPPRES